MRYRKKPVVIEAEQWNGDPDGAMPAWMAEAVHDGRIILDRGEMYVDTLEGEMHASVGDFIIRGVRGELYPCKPDVFAQTYELAE